MASKEYQREWRERHPEKLREYRKRYEKLHPEKIKEKYRKKANYLNGKNIIKNI